MLENENYFKFGTLETTPKSSEKSAVPLRSRRDDAGGVHEKNLHSVQKNDRSRTWWSEYTGRKRKTADGTQCESRWNSQRLSRDDSWVTLAKRKSQPPQKTSLRLPLRALKFILPDHHESADVDVEMPPRRAPVAEISAPAKVVLPGKQQDVPPPPSARRLIPG